MELTLGYGSYCKVSGYQEGLESSVDCQELGDMYRTPYWENIHQWDGLDY